MNTAVQRCSGEVKQTQIRSFSGESPPTYVHGRDISPPLLYLRLSICTILVELLRFLVLFLQTLLFAYILERILYDACNFTSNVLNYVCHSFLNVLLLVFIFGFADLNFIIPKGVFFFKNYMFNIP